MGDKEKIAKATLSLFETSKGYYSINNYDEFLRVYTAVNTITEYYFVSYPTVLYKEISRLYGNAFIFEIKTYGYAIRIVVKSDPLLENRGKYCERLF